VSFQPSIEVDRSAFGLKVSRQEFPVGVAGVRLSLNEIARRVREGGRSPSVRAFAAHVLNAAGIPPSQTLDATQTAQVFLDYVHANVRYVPDPVLTEFNQIAEVTLCVPGAPMCIPIGDCDDLIVALASLLMSVGIPARIVKQTFGDADQEHVTIQFQTESGDWVYADPSIKDKPLGWHAPASEEVMIDPNDPAAIGMVAGTPEAEFVGVGRAWVGAGFSPKLLPPGPSQWSPTHPWPWRSIGAAATVTADPFIQSANDLTTMNTVISAGDTGVSSSNWQGAVSSYQAAGNQGATVLGPEIVSASAAASGITGPIIQQAVTLNSTLQALNNSTPNSTDATTAQGLVKQMAALYAQAIDAGRVTLAGGGGLTFTQQVFIAVAVGAILGSGWAYYKSTQGKAAASPATHKKARRHPHKRLAARRRR
jgi:Transglutaminase-like superfamily